MENAFRKSEEDNKDDQISQNRRIKSLVRDIMISKFGNPGILAFNNYLYS